MAYETKQFMENDLKGQMVEGKEALGKIIGMLQAMKENPGIKQLVEEGKIKGFEEEQEYTDKEDFARGYCNCCRCEPKYPCKCRRCDALKAEAHKNVALMYDSIGDLLRILEAAGEEFQEIYEYLTEAIKFFIWAEECSRRNCCECHCRTCR